MTFSQTQAWVLCLTLTSGYIATGTTNNLALPGFREGIFFWLEGTTPEGGQPYQCENNCSANLLELCLKLLFSGPQFNIQPQSKQLLHGQCCLHEANM